MADLEWILHHTPSLRDVTLSIRTPSLPFRLLTPAFPPSGNKMRSLTTTASAFMALRQPRNTLTSISIRVSHSEVLEWTQISLAFEGTLRSLRLIRTSERPIAQESPARICGQIWLKSLKYLEVLDSSPSVSLSFRAGSTCC